MSLRTVKIPMGAAFKAQARVGPPEYAPPTYEYVKGTHFDYPAWHFAADEEQTVFFVVQVPQGATPGTDAFVKFGWISTSTAGSVRWRVQYQPKRDGVVWDTAFAASTEITSPAPGTVGEIQQVTLTLAEPVIQAGDSVVIAISRVGNHADDDHAKAATLIDLDWLVDGGIAGGGGGGGDLAATLILGNVTGGSDIVLSGGDVIVGSAGVAGTASILVTFNTAPLADPGNDGFYLGIDWPYFLRSSNGPRTSGEYDPNFDGSLLSPAAIAADMVAAINDPGNSLTGRFVATDLGGGTLRVDAATAGPTGNLLRLQKRFASSGNVTVTPSSGVLSGGTSGTRPVVLRTDNSALQLSIGGESRGQGAVDLQTSRTHEDRVAAGPFSVALGGRNNRTEQTDSVVAGRGNIMRTGTNEPSFLFGSDNYVQFAPYNSLIGGHRHKLYGKGPYLSEWGGSSLIWGREFEIHDTNLQGHYGAYFGSFHEWEEGAWTQGNLVAGERVVFKDTGGRFCGYNAVIGTRINVLEAGASLIVGEGHDIVDAWGAVVTGFGNFIRNTAGGGALGASVAVTRDGVFGFGGGHRGPGHGQFSLASMFCETRIIPGKMILGIWSSSPPDDRKLLIWPDSAWAFELTISARHVSGGLGDFNDSATWKFFGQIKRDKANNTVLVGLWHLRQIALTDEVTTILAYHNAVGEACTPSFGDVGAEAWTVAIGVNDTEETFDITCVGGTNDKVTRFEGFMRLIQVAGAPTFTE